MNQITTNQENTNNSAMQSYCFSSAQNFESAQRMAMALSKASIVPKEYQNNTPNCIIALEIAHRMNASPTMVMQNLYIVHGKPSWSSQFIISAVNSCGRFRPLRFEMTGKKGTDERACIAWTTEKNVELPSNIRTLEDAHKENLPVLEGSEISVKIAKDEGWYGKNGSKWKTLPEQMLRYRAASFFGKLYAPEILMGMQTSEEVEDIGVKDVTPKNNDKFTQAFHDHETGEVIEEKPKEKAPSKLDKLLKEEPKKEAKEKSVPKEEVTQKEESKPVEIDAFEKKANEIMQQVKDAMTMGKLKEVETNNEKHIVALRRDQQIQINDLIAEKEDELS